MKSPWHCLEVVAGLLSRVYNRRSRGGERMTELMGEAAESLSARIHSHTEGGSRKHRGLMTEWETDGAK
ncbi:hypothetical protein PBY51_015581 [Eleginops maclovinus]|uniref:Uncharacterized protein n=1 Tax=Eleginops maclovinus TaxID=56733 RepID=A0AAN7XPG1_ELEMC|nr:hypothetical protein PBY51_015581 [Eleginops maclovinus]